MSQVIDLLNEMKRLMELRGENPFKTRAFDQAAQMLAGRDDLLERAKAGTLRALPGVGKGIEDVLNEFLLHGRTSARDELLQALPPGLLELTEVPGLGPKKAMVLIEELGIHSVAELEYACKEHRLLKLKGFGPKLQQKILDGVLFRNAHQGMRKSSDVEDIAHDLERQLQAACPGVRVVPTGALRRKLEVIQRFEFLIEGEPRDLSAIAGSSVLPVELCFATTARFGSEWVRTTGTPEHWAALGNPSATEAGTEASTEEDFYERLGLPWISPELRETGEEVALARKGELSRLLPWDGIRGVFHNHTTRSDGAATLEEMVIAAKAQGFEYIGISDHSQTAFYAQGLKVDVLLAQEMEIRKVQEKHPEIRIFWGIESDILGDGSLDYNENVLKKFDFVVASVHSRFQMDRKEMTERILKAVRNPYTRFLGHPTGRLLLGRKGYDIDMEAILSAAAECDVAVELNSNPARLDIDWRWGPEMRKRKTLTSINPDAHDVEGLKDTRYGVAMARKALLPVESVVNARSPEEVSKWLKRA